MSIHRHGCCRVISLLLFCSALPGSAWSQAPPRKAPPGKGVAAPASGADAVKYKGIWEPVNYKEDLQLTDIFFVTPETGWVSGYAGTILKTTDGGANWTPQLGGDPQSQERAIGDLRFVSETTGWATQITGTHTNLLRTADGENWEQVGTIPEHYADYTFTTESEGIFVHLDKIFLSHDGGRAWKPSSECKAKIEVQGLMRDITCEILSLYFPSPTVGYGLAYTGVDAALIMKTEDGGATWAPAGLLDKEYARDGAIFFTDENNGVVVAYSGKSYVTSDGGQTWRGMVATQLGARIRFADPEVGWSFANLCVGMGCANARLSYTTDGGRRWTSRSFAFPAGVTAFSLPRRDRGYAAGAHGMIYRYRIVPAHEQIAKAIDAPAMPGFESPLDDQVAALQQQLQSLEQTIEQKTGQQIEITPISEDATAEAAPPAAEVTEESADADAGPGLAEQVASQQLSAIEGTVTSLNAEVPSFSGKLRNLNMVFTGLQVVGQLFGQAQSLKDSITQLRKARDIASISAALSQLTGQTQGLVQSTRSAFQAPQQ